MADESDGKGDASGHEDADEKDGASDQDDGGNDESNDDEEHDREEKDGKDDDEEDKPKAKWPWIVAGIVVFAFIAVILVLVLVPHENVTTDDAYVTAHYAMISPRVSGTVAQVLVDDNQPVTAGQPLVRLDPRDFETALEQAKANRQADDARVDQASAQLARQPALIRQAEAQVASAIAKLALATADQRRFANLADSGAGTVQQHQQADAALRQAQATLAQAEAERASQRRQTDALAADVEAARAQVGRDDAAVDQAQLNLAYTELRAPITGAVAQRTVQIGSQVSPGTPLMFLVPLERAYIIAHYRELELRHMLPGQHARIHLDAYDIDLDGIVQSVGPASGATFSPIPPNNATGNFTKIVQRLPVKIVVAPNQPLARLLRAGMSVEVTVDTNLDDVVEMQQNQAYPVVAP